MTVAGKLAYSRCPFDPGPVYRPPAGPTGAEDLRRDPPYVFTEQIVLAVNVAIATRRPLLVRGESGSGKSSLARSVAHVLGWRYYEHVITSRTQARDLLWEVDLVRRLNDARSDPATLGDDLAPYIVPRVLWWAMSPNTARWRGTDPKQERVKPLDDPYDPGDAARAVVLLDEIDKADPDVPNNLLVPLGSLQFLVEETGTPIEGDPLDNAPLIFLTTNEERRLPVPFLRRCVEIELKLPTRGRLLQIARAHFPDLSPRYLRRLAEALFGLDDDQPVPASQAEFLDTVRACDDLNVKIGSPAWNDLTAITMWKHGRTRPGSS